MTQTTSYSLGYKQGPNDKYDAAAEDGAKAFRMLIAMYYAGEITLSALNTRFQSGLEQHYVRMMLLALDGTREPTARDYEILRGHLNKDLAYLDGFITDISTGRATQARAMWRAGMYGFPRAAYVNFTIPTDIANLMPVLPGDDCLGGSYCACWLDVVTDDDGTAYVYWMIDPLTESYPVCIAHAIESPFIFTSEQISAEGERD